jgi:digeranylgeranylglycerophospholipid reductase
MQKIEEPDVVVIGAGPAGSTTTAEINNRSNKRVILIDRRKEIGVPGRCAGGISIHQLAMSDTQLTDDLILNKIYGMKVVSPDKTEITVGDTLGTDEPHGYIIDRPKFDRMLFNRINPDLTETIVGQSADTDGQIVTCGTRKFRPKRIVLACAYDEKLIRRAGLDIRISKDDIHRCIQVTIPTNKYSSKYIWSFAGNSFAPGGYAWIFPESSSVARVGLGIPCSNTKSPWRYLDLFLIKEDFIDLPQTHRTGKLLPTLWYRKDIHKGKVALVGDAGFQVNPLTGGGIGYALIAAKCLGRTIALDEDYSTYEKAWRLHLNKRLHTDYIIKSLLYGLSDAELNKAAAGAVSVNMQTVKDLPSAGRELLKRNKRLLWKLALMKLRRKI